MFDNAITTLKIIIFGSSGVGKTSILTQLVDNEFSDTKETISPDLKTKKYTYEGKLVNLALWDTAGTERYLSVTPNLYRGAQGAVVVYDITDYQSFRELQGWMSNLEDYYDGSKNYPIVIILGNKIDKDGREVPRQEGLNFAKRHRALFLETSAKTNSFVDTAFDELVAKIMETPGLCRTNMDNLSIVRLNQNTSHNPNPIITQLYKNCAHC